MWCALSWVGFTHTPFGLFELRGLKFKCERWSRRAHIHNIMNLTQRRDAHSLPARRERNLWTLALANNRSASRKAHRERKREEINTQAQASRRIKIVSNDTLLMGWPIFCSFTAVYAHLHKMLAHDAGDINEMGLPR